MPINQSDGAILDIHGAVALGIERALDRFIGPLAIIRMKSGEENLVVYRGTPVEVRRVLCIEHPR